MPSKTPLDRYSAAIEKARKRFDRSMRQMNETHARRRRLFEARLREDERQARARLDEETSDHAE